MQRQFQSALLLLYRMVFARGLFLFAFPMGAASP